MLLAQIIVNGILLGGLYGLMALGMALVWGVLNIVNLAHGAFIMLGGYAVYFLFSELGIDPFLALPIAMAVMFAFGYLLQLLVLNQIVRSAMLNTLLITFGLDVVLTYLAQLLFTADFRTIGPSYAGGQFHPSRGHRSGDPPRRFRRRLASRGDHVARSCRACRSAARSARRRKTSPPHGSMASIRASSMP